MFGEAQVNHWFGLVDAGAVLLLLGVWVLLDDTRRWLRHAAVAMGAALLLAVAGSAVARIQSIASIVSIRDFFEEDKGRHVFDLVLLAVTTVAGLVFVAFARDDTAPAADDDGADLDEEDDDDGVVEEPVSLPQSAWSRSEVVGTTSHWDEPEEPAPAPARRLPRLPRLREPAAGWPSRGIALPVLAVAVGASLPMGGLGPALVPGSFNTAAAGGGTLLQLLRHAADGLVVGGAVLGVTLALDVWERRLVLWAFLLAALGAGLGGATFEPFGNEFWVMAAIGAATGLLVASAVRVLRSARTLRRSAFGAGVAGALLLLSAQAVVLGRIFASGFERG
ncbi:MAG TPA: hypothetical protein VFQ85_17440 [Mycobacteriales bacterium]|nr:hypothetical protein [Mycobacteriales bacterium]